MAVSTELERISGGAVIGIDEAGRGPLAGGVYAAAVSVPADTADALLAGAWKGIDDSKKLSPAKRERLAEAIKSTPGCVWAVASASAAEIDELNILRATHLAMRRAAEKAGSALGGGDGVSILVDGLPVKGLPYPSRNVVKGDSKSVLVAAASILAKTARDAECEEMEKRFPGYGFAAHKGYPTKAHVEALGKLGPCPEHRRTFAPVAKAISLRRESGEG
jgi:ribonuclease HII